MKYDEAKKIFSKYGVRYLYSKGSKYTINIGQNPPPEFFKEMESIGFSVRERPEERGVNEFKKFLENFSDEATLMGYEGEGSGIALREKGKHGWFDNSDPDEDYVVTEKLKEVMKDYVKLS